MYNSTFAMVVQSTIISHVDYCNHLLSTLPVHNLTTLT